MDHFLPTGGGGGSAPARAHAADSRLLANLVRAEKDSMGALAQATSALHTAASALAAWGAAEGSGGVGATADMASASAAIAGLFHAVADSERTHVAAIDGYRSALKDVMAREESIRDVLRDRDILVGRLIKASKKRVKDNRVDAQAEKINDAQRELRACETVLAAEQTALIGVKRRTFKEALTMRAKTMGDVGNSMVEAAQEAILLLDAFDSQRPNYYDDAGSIAYAPQVMQDPALSSAQDYYPHQIELQQHMLQQPYADNASTFHDAASYAEPAGYPASAQYRPPSVYTTNVLPGQQFVASDPVSSPSVPIAAAPAAESYNAAPVSSSASVSVPTGIPTSAGYSDLDPAVRGSLAAAPASGAERPSIPAPHRLNSQTGVATDAFFPSNETAASSEAASAVPEDAVGDPSGPNGAPPYLGSGNGQLDQEGLALKVSPAPASELAAHTAVVGSGGAPVPPHSAPSTTASSGRTEEPNLTPRYEHPLALQQLSPDQQQQQHQYYTSQAQTQLGTPQSYPAQQAQVQGHYLPRIQAPQTYHLKQSSAYGADDNQSAYYDSYQHHTPSLTQTLRNIHGQAPNFSANPAYLTQQSNYQPGTFQNSSSYQNALQGISSPADEPSAGRRPSAGSQRPQSVKKSSSGFFGRMSKLFRTDIRDASEASQSANRRESREPESHGAPDVDSSDEEADAATAYDQARTRTAAASGDGWHTRTDSNLRSIKGVPGGRSLISRASNALGREEDSSSDEEPETAVHVNGQYASDAASARTGKRSLLSRMSGRGSQNGTAGTRDDTNETQRIVPGPMSLRQHEAEVQRRARDSVVGAGIGQQPAPPKPEGSLVRSASTPAGSAVKRKVVKKKVVKRPVSRAESDLEGVKTSPVKRASSSAAKPLRTLTLIGDASTGTRNSRISAAGHGSASGHSSSVAPLASGKYATSNWVSTSKDVQLAPKASQHKARTRTSAGHAPPQSGGQGEGSKSHQPDELDREKTPRPRPGSTASRPASRANRALSATPTASTDPPLVVTAPPRAKDLLNAPSYSGPRASTYVTPTTAGITALRSGADVNAAGQPNYLTHYDPPMEQARAGTATPTAGTRKVVRKVKRVKSAAGAMSAPTTPIPQDSPVKVKRHVSLSARPTSAVGTGKHLPTAHDARPLSPAIKSPTPYDDEGVTRRKSVRMAPDTKLATEPRTVKVVKKVKKSAAGAKAAPAELSPVPFQVTAPKSSIVRSAQPPPIAMAPSLHSSTAASAPTRPASAPGQGFIARAPGSSLSGMGFIPSAPGSSVVSPSAIANPGRTAALPRQPARGSATQNERPRPASSAGWATRIGRDDSSDDEAPVTPDGDEYARARRAFSSASRHLGMATKRGGPVHPSQVRAV